MNRANTYDEIAPFIDLCKNGKLFEVQDWIAQGKPTDLPLTIPPKERKKNPLQIAIELGFYSLAQILVEGGASLEEPRYLALRHALEKRRLDIVQMLVKNGAKIDSVHMKIVFDTWDKEIIRFFIENGADCQTDQPLTYAFNARIRPALAIYMQYKDRFSHFREQIDMALRYHCKEGNLKWVALLLWAGADPYTKGPELPDDEPEEYLSALEFAALYGHLKIFKLKSIHLDPKYPGAMAMLGRACYADNADILKLLIKCGFSPKDLNDKGSSLIEPLFNLMSRWECDPWTDFKTKRDLDTSRAREKIKMIHLLVRHGARWEPRERFEIANVRRALRMMNPDYTMEFIWIMTEYNACTVEVLDKLMKPPEMRALIVKYIRLFDKMMGAFRALSCQEPTGN